MSNQPSVLVADQISEKGVKLLQKNNIKVIVKTGLNDTDLKAQLKKHDGVIVRSATKITAKVMTANSKLKIIGRAGIGVDNIDVAAATENGVMVLNTPEANATTTAELAIAHIFSLARNLTAADASVKEGKWERSKYTGTEISGKTVGVVGYGTIGRIVAERCRGLSLNVLVYDPFVSKNIVEEDGHKLTNLNQLLKSSDFVTIHTPGSKSTMNLITTKEFKLMKPSSYLIQCARGGIVNEDDLATALNKEQIAGAAVDVYTTEPMPINHVLRKVKNISFTPHLGASTKEAQLATGIAISNQFIKYFKTGEVVNAINVPRIPADVLKVTQPYLPLAKAIGKILAESCSKRPDVLEIKMFGQAADLPSSIITAETVAGILESKLSIPVNQVNAVSLAERQGLKIINQKDHSIKEFATKLKVTLHCGQTKNSISGTLLGGAQPRIAFFNDIEIEAPLTGAILLTNHLDKPGIIAEISSLLAKNKINISHMHVGSDAKGQKAVACFRLEKMLSDAILNKIKKVKHINNVIHLRL